jgi:hypothetical protein
MKELVELAAMARHGAPAARQNLGGQDLGGREQPIRFTPPDGLATPVGGNLKIRRHGGLERVRGFLEIDLQHFDKTSCALVVVINFPGRA